MGIFDEIAERKITRYSEKDELSGTNQIDDSIKDDREIDPSEKKEITSKIINIANTLPEEAHLKKEIIKLNTLIRDQISDEEKEALLNKRTELLCQLDIFLENYRINI